MAKQPLEKLLVEAQKAYQKKDKHTGARLIDEILQADFNHPGAWELLYHLFGGGKPFNEFQRSFATQFYPDKLGLLQTKQPGEQGGAAGTAPVSEKKPSFLNKLFGRAKKTSPEAGRSLFFR